MGCEWGREEWISEQVNGKLCICFDKYIKVTIKERGVTKVKVARSG